MKSKATGCGSISTVFCSIVLMCVSSIIIVTITVKIRPIVMIMRIRSNYKEFGGLFLIFCAK